MRTIRGCGVATVRTATCTIATRVTTSGCAGAMAKRFGTTPATISCSASEIANATANRRRLEPPKKTPSHCCEKGSALTGRGLLLRAGIVSLYVPLSELVVSRIVAVLVVEPVAIGVLTPVDFLLLLTLLALFVVVVNDERNRCGSCCAYGDDRVRTPAAIGERGSGNACSKRHR